MKFLLRKKNISDYSLSYSSNINLNQPIIYLLNNYSRFNIYILHIYCLKIGLPSPFETLYIYKKKYIKNIILYKKKFIILSTTNDHKKFNIFPYKQYFNLHKKNNKLNIQIILVSLFLKKYHIKKNIFFIKKYFLKSLNILYFIKNILKIYYCDYNQFIKLSKPISTKYLLFKYYSDILLIKKLIKIANIYFIRQKLIIQGQPILKQNKIFENFIEFSQKNNIFLNTKINNFKNLLYIKQYKKNFLEISKKMFSLYSHKILFLIYLILKKIFFNKYNELFIYNTERLKKIIDDNNIIVYIPCHKSHIDSLLLSFVLCNQGISTPYIIAGNNLNHWPIGYILRKCGAIFIKRVFHFNKLYFSVFYIYLKSLFDNNNSIGYFIEGGRSRTGKLLSPKNGILNMIIKIILNKNTKPILIIPIYIGYENILEINDFINHPKYNNKKSISFNNIFNNIFYICKIYKLRKSYINFGEPINLQGFILNKLKPQKEKQNLKKNFRSVLSNLFINKIANYIMIQINNLTIINPVNLCAVIILSSSRKSMFLDIFLNQLKIYLNLIFNITYTTNTILSIYSTAKENINYTLLKKKISIKNNNIYKTKIIYITKQQEKNITYMRNNIIHIFILPSLILKIIFSQPGILYKKLYNQIFILYPLIQVEFMTHYNTFTLKYYIKNFLNELIKQNLIFIKNNINYFPIHINLHHGNLIKNHVTQSLPRYAVIFYSLYTINTVHYLTLHNNIKILSKKLSIIYNKPESFFYIKEIILNIFPILTEEKYIINNQKNKKKIKRINIILYRLLFKKEKFLYKNKFYNNSI